MERTTRNLLALFIALSLPAAAAAIARPYFVPPLQPRETELPRGEWDVALVVASASRSPEEAFMRRIRADMRAHGLLDFPQSLDKLYDGKVPQGGHFLDHTFVVNSSYYHYLIQAIDKRGRVTWEVSDNAPLRAVAPMYCPRELPARASPSHEAAAFLVQARTDIRAFYAEHGRMPQTWGELRMHWSLEDHFRDAQDITAPPNAGTRWRPRGSNYTFVQESTAAEIRLRSTNDQGLPDYILSGIEGRRFRITQPQLAPSNN